MSAPVVINKNTALLVTMAGQHSSSLSTCGIIKTKQWVLYTLTALTVLQDGALSHNLTIQDWTETGVHRLANEKCTRTAGSYSACV